MPHGRRADPPNFADTSASDDVRESLSEAVVSFRSRLDHRWTFEVAAGSRVELHVEGFRTASPDGDNFAFEYSLDQIGWMPIALSDLPLVDNDIDLIGSLPATLSGTVFVRVVDTNQDLGAIDIDTVGVDEIFIRSVP